MSTLATTNIKHPSSASTNIVLDSSARVGIGTASPGATLHVNSNSTGTAAKFESTGSGSYLNFVNNAGSSVYVGAASTSFFVETNGSERMRITNGGTVYIGKTTADFALAGTVIYASGEINLTQSSASPLYINRTTNDGNLVAFYQDGNLEGTISVSGATVSYNGAHLSRWSQLPPGVERTEILRGSVLSNLDEMCDWDDEENEQLNRMKVSDVEGDKNVSGVFQAWDDDDDTYTDDFYCAMTGDFIIRIGDGVTVERGDLLMSAGDGTAKPQDDDIIRSKTIAKVTSTNVSCTYEDGSYCVPCVLMAC